MELEIQIVRDPCHELAKHRVRVFGPNGGNIGRSPNNYWSLPDPKSYVSGQHCEVEFRGEAFWLRDTSRNGVFVNDSTERVGYGHRVRLNDGDRLRLGLYELLVRLRHQGQLVHPDLVRSDGRDVLQGGTSTVLMDSVETEAGVGVSAEAGRSGAAEVATETRQPANIPVGPVADVPADRVVRFDKARLRDIGLMPPEAEERLVANQFRQIKRALLANAFGKGVPAIANGRLMMMTSALPGEGKTFSTLNLALSLARERDLDVLVVDADVAKPQVSGLFKLDKAPGLLEALSDDSIDIESLVLRTDVFGLSFLPAGRCEGDVATELLASVRMQDTLLRLVSRADNRVILFDSPPLLLTNEARVMASIVGQVIMVVRAGVTPQQAVLEAIGYIGEDRPIGLVLNQSKASAPGSYYGYGAYGYGGYGSNAEDRSR